MKARFWLHSLDASLVAILASATFLPSGAAQSIRYSVGIIDALTGGVSSYPTAINNAGQIVGASQNANGIYHAVVWSTREGVKDLGTLDSPDLRPYNQSVANAINANGVIVGQSNGRRAFVVRNGVMSALPGFYTDGGSPGLASGINAAGDIVGEATSVTRILFTGDQLDGPVHAFRYRNNVLTDLGTIVSTVGKSAAYGINDNGDIVGASATPVGFFADHAFLYRGSQMLDLGVLPGFQASSAGGINNSGQIFGYVRTGSLALPTTHGFIYEGGTMKDIGLLPGGDFTLPLGINNRGQIVGTASDSRGRRSAFVWTQSSGIVDISNRDFPLIGSSTSPYPAGTFVGFTKAIAINDFGVIAALGEFSSGGTRAFMLIPDDAVRLRISDQPASQTVVVGGAAVFSFGVANAFGGALTGVIQYQWSKDGAVIAGATGSTLTIPNVQNPNIGSYSAVATSAFGSVASNAAILAFGTASNLGRLVNLSIRSIAGGGDGTLIVGIVLGGVGTSGSKPILARGIGPALADFGVGGVLSDPVMTLMSGTSTLATNDNWGGVSQIVTASAQVGAFVLANVGGKDAAIYDPSVAPGSYTLQITGVGGATGVALAEVYDATPSASFTSGTPRLVNVSARTQVGTGSNILITGFAIGGQTAKTLLIRAVGPSLTQFGVGSVLVDPQLQLFDSSSRQIAANNDWGGTASLSAAFAGVGAFALPPNSRDAALVISLTPGSYTAQVSGVNNGVGVALVEVYEVP